MQFNRPADHALLMYRSQFSPLYTRPSRDSKQREREHRKTETNFVLRVYFEIIFLYTYLELYTFSMLSVAIERNIGLETLDVFTAFFTVIRKALHPRERRIEFEKLFNIHVNNRIVFISSDILVFLSLIKILKFKIVQEQILILSQIPEC